jgi:alkyl sulfatase BDS1-like metallo-beta-lactamase superfamily hydrolase
MTKTEKVFACSVAMTFIAFSSQAAAQAQDETDAERTLRALNPGLAPHFVQLADNVFVASGYGVSTIGFIVGTDGVVVVDSGAAAPTTAEALAELRKHTDLPISAIIFTHGHGDHTGGAPGLIEGDNKPIVWAHENFGIEGRAFSEAGLTANRARGQRQAGFLLPQELRINNGIAPALERGRGAPTGFQSNQDPILPTHTFSEQRKSIAVAGVELELVSAPGETDDQLYVWYADKRVVFSGDNFYRSWPNIYAIRGTPYRDARSWAISIDKMLAEGPEHVVPGHTQAVSGSSEVAELLTSYRDGIQYLFDKTIEGMNKGMTPDQLVEYVTLPDELASHPYLQPYYGHPDWAVRSIFAGYLGWFDGNATNLQQLSKLEHAQRVADLAGGSEALLDRARSALADGDSQWAAELCDHLIALGEHKVEAMLIKADALETLGRNFSNATGRNYYLTAAKQLREIAASAE